jgi:LAO/AO transport system kinase
MELLEGILAGQTRAVARAISLIEDGEPEAEALADELFPHTGGATVIGVTGSPGSGKSSLVDRLIFRERARGRRVAVLAVDPSSPFSGGAMLGDRLRMQEHATDPGVFIRSMASRGTLGGVAAACGDVLKVLDAAGFQTIYLETIGVGQSEIKVVELADAVLLLLMPGAGDEIQVLKAGVMEIGDLFVINKCDLPGADKLRSEVEYVLSLKDQPQGGAADPVVLVSALSDEGIDTLEEALRAWLQEAQRSGALAERRKLRIRREIEGALSRKVHALLDAHIELPRQIEGWVERLYRRETAPYALVREQVGRLVKEWKR